MDRPCTDRSPTSDRQLADAAAIVSGTIADALAAVADDSPSRFARTGGPTQPIAAVPRQNHPPVRVAVVNDYELVVRGVTSMLQPFDDRIDVVEMDVLAEPHRKVDVALFDAYGSPHHGIDRVRQLAASPNVGSVVVFTFHTDDADTAELLNAGARSVVSKATQATDLAATLVSVATGGTATVDGGSPHRRTRHEAAWPGAELGLTARESEVAALLCSGAPNRSIAGALSVSENTVKTHLKAVFHKLDVSTRAGAVAHLLTTPSFRRRGHLHPV